MDPELIEKLRDPAIYPEGAGAVEILQTHLSVVVLSGDRAYKFKKAIRLPFADFTSLESRHRFCGEEVRLNRRLCPEIYEAVVDLCENSSGRLRIGEGGTVIDHAVRMKRLPQDRMMDGLLEHHKVGHEEIGKVARQMVAFHLAAERGPEVTAWGDPVKLREFALANFSETEGCFPPPLHEALERRTRDDFDQWLPVLQERAAGGCIVDGHGDLHARNICLLDSPVIYDCIEFNPAFRCGDVATEHAFLAMDLRFRGHPELAEAYTDAVMAASGDEAMGGLLPMLVRYRAMVRAKVSAIAAGEVEMGEAARSEASDTARRYLRLAAATAVEEERPRWILCCGLPASGKSVLASQLALSSGGAWPVFSSDRVRKELAGVAPTSTLAPEWYEAGPSRLTYDEMLSRALSATRSGRVVILDANFRSRSERQRFREAARMVGARVDLLHVELHEAIARERLRDRAASGDSVSDAGVEVYERLRPVFESPGEEEADRVLSVHGESDAGEMVEEVLAALLERERSSGTKR